MSDNVSTIANEHLTTLMQTALVRGPGSPIAVECETKAQAVRLRLQCYRVRTQDKKNVAEVTEVPLNKARSDFDKLVFTIQPQPSGKWDLVIQVVDISQLKIIDPRNREPISVEESGFALDAFDD